MTILAQVQTSLQRVLIEEARKAGRETGFIQRAVKVNGDNFCQTLVLGWLEKPDATLEELCQTGVSLGLEVTAQGLAQRFTEPASRCLRQVLEAAVGELVEAEVVSLPSLQQFTGVYLEDSSIVTLPDELAGCWQGSGQAGVKLQLRWDQLRGSLDGPYLSNSRVHDRVAGQQNQPLPEGSLLIRDLGYWNLSELDKLSQKEVYWLSRAKSQTHFYDDDGRCWTQAAFVRRQQADCFDIPIRLGKVAQVPARFVGWRVPPETARKWKKQVAATAKRRGSHCSQDRLTLCEWTLLVTTVPQPMLSLEAVAALARLRWQIELLFKLWKSQGMLDKSRSAQPWRILCEFYAKLIGLIIQHWALLTGACHHLSLSLVKASAIVRRHAFLLARTLRHPRKLRQTLKELQYALSRAPHINKSRRTPRTFQLLAALEPSHVLR